MAKRCARRHKRSRGNRGLECKKGIRSDRSGGAGGGGCTLPLCGLIGGSNGRRAVPLALNRSHPAGNPERTFKSVAVPGCRVGCRRVGCRQKVEQQGVRVLRLRNRIVGKDELAKRWVKGAPLRDLRVAEASWLWIGVGIEGGTRKRFVSRPKARAAHFVRIGFARDVIGQARHAPWVGRGGSSREPRDGKIEAAPEEVDCARLADKSAAEELEDAVRLHQRAPEAMGGGRVVGGVRSVLRKADRIRNFVRHFLDPDRNVHAAQQVQSRMVEISDRLGLKRQEPFGASAGSRAKPMGG